MRKNIELSDNQKSTVEDKITSYLQRNGAGVVTGLEVYDVIEVNDAFASDEQRISWTDRPYYEARFHYEPEKGGECRGWIEFEASIIGDKVEDFKIDGEYIKRSDEE